MGWEKLKWHQLAHHQLMSQQQSHFSPHRKAKANDWYLVVLVLQICEIIGGIVPLMIEA